MTDGTTAISYAYNADGLRISKTVDSVTYNYVYVGSTLTDVTWGNNSLHFVYDALGASAVIYNGTTYYYYLRNAQGDITGIVDTSGTVVVSYTYDAWGKLLSTTGSLAATLGADNPLRYRGYVYDTETGLYYLTSRYYNPSWGRFINADGYASTGQGFVGNNMFAYCLNNPVNMIDVDGDEAVSITLGVMTDTGFNDNIKIIENRCLECGKYSTKYFATRYKSSYIISEIGKIGFVNEASSGHTVLGSENVNLTIDIISGEFSGKIGKDGVQVAAGIDLATAEVNVRVIGTVSISASANIGIGAKAGVSFENGLIAKAVTGLGWSIAIKWDQPQ